MTVISALFLYAAAICSHGLIHCSPVSKTQIDGMYLCKNKVLYIFTGPKIRQDSIFCLYIGLFNIQGCIGESILFTNCKIVSSEGGGENAGNYIFAKVLVIMD